MLKNGYILILSTYDYTIQDIESYSVSKYEAIIKRIKYDDIWLLITNNGFFWVKDTDLSALGVPDDAIKLLQLL